MAERIEGDSVNRGVGNEGAGESGGFLRLKAAPKAPTSPTDELLDLRFLVVALLRGSWLIGLLVAVAVILGVRELRSYVPQHVATMVVAPAVGDSQLAAQASRLSGLARSLGVEGSAGLSTSTFDRLQLVVGSQTLAKILQDKYGYMQKFFAGSWNVQTNQWVRPAGRRFDLEQKVKGALNLKTWSKPTLESLARFADSKLVFEQVGATGFQKVSVSHVDPEFALEILQVVYSEADDLLKEQDRTQTAERRRYLEQQLSRAGVVEMRAALVGLLVNEERTAMLLEGDLPYAARIIEPPFVSVFPSTPSLLQIVGVRAFLFALVGSALVILVALFRRE